MATILWLCVASGAGGAPEFPFQFVDVSRSWGLQDSVRGMMAHAGCAGDVDGDGDVDLYIGGFCDRPPEAYVPVGKPVANVLLLKEPSGFRPSSQACLALKARTSGAVFADLDNDGDLDCAVSNNSKSRGLRVPNKIFENRSGTFFDVSGGNPFSVIMGGRSIGVFDYDGDGLLDLFVCEDRFTGRRSRLYRNRSSLRFEDRSERAGLPANLPGLGVAVCDWNHDGRPDFFVSQANRLFLSQPGGRYRDGSSPCFFYPPQNREASPCGVACADVDGDGDCDLLCVDHSQPARQHLFLNLGLEGGIPVFEEATERAGLAYRFPSWSPGGRHLKHAHAALADFDNDGRVDILISATFTSRAQAEPFICRNMGVRGHVVRFQCPQPEKATSYFAAGPVCDIDRDGRMDIVCLSWWPEGPSYLFLNRTRGGNWLLVRVAPKEGNSMGVGSVVRVFEAGTRRLLGVRHLYLSDGFCTGGEALAHFGLGEVSSCDVEVTLPLGRGILTKHNVRANQLITIGR